MIINCINCNKNFNVNSELIPDKGRTIQCGSCNHKWFFNKNNQPIIEFDIPLSQKNKVIQTKKSEQKESLKTVTKTSKNAVTQITEVKNSNDSEIVKNYSKSNFRLSKILSYIVVFIITFITLVMILDTLKSPLYKFFPKLEFLLFSLFETLRDIQLFVKDLI
jgi:predicted Zn finger-like uncharacterized protein